MYARDVDGKTLTLAVSGKLWNRSLVMIDSETKSLWSHLLGEAMSGPQKGAKLKTLPSSMTDWKTWREMHPSTTVITLSRTSQNFRREFYRNPAQFVIGLSVGDKTRAWAFDQLIKQPLVNDQCGDLPLVVAFDRQSSSAFVFDRRVDGRAVTLELREQNLIDPQTGAQWNRLTGESLSDGTDLKPAPAIVSFRKSWEVFHPETTFFEAR